jgi:hypothetical protein
MRYLEVGGKKYSLTVASDVIRDGMALELDDVTEGSPRLVLFAFYSDSDGAMTFASFGEELPLELVDWFIFEARRALPPVEVSSKEDMDKQCRTTPPKPTG